MNDLFEGFEGVKPVEAASDPFADFEGVTPVGQALPAVGDPLSAFRAKLADPKEYERIKRFAGYLGTTPEDPIVAERLTNPLNFSSYSTLNQLKTTGNVDEVNRMTPEGNVDGLGLKAALTQFGHAGGVLRRRNDALVSRIAAGQELEVGDTRDIGAQIATGMAGVPRPNLRTFKKIEDMTRAEQDATVPKEIVDLVNQYDSPEAPLDARTRAKAIYEAAKSSATAREQTMEMAAEELALREELTGKSDGFMNSLGVLAAKGMPTVGYGQTFLVGGAIGGPAGAFAAATAVSGADKTSELLTADINPDTGEMEKQGTDYDTARVRGYAYGAFEAASEQFTGKVLGTALKGLDKVTGGYVGKALSKGLDAGARQMAKTSIGRGVAELAKGIQRIAGLQALDNPVIEILGEEGIQQWGDAVFAQRPSDTETPVYVKNVLNEATGEMEQMQVEPGSDEERTAKRMLTRYGEKSGYAEAGTRQMTVGEKTKEFGEEFFTWDNMTALAEGFALQYALTLGGGALHAVQTKESRRQQGLDDKYLLAAGFTNADLIRMSDEQKAEAFDGFYGAEANRDKFAEVFKDAGEMLSLSAQRLVDSDRWMRTGEGIKPNFSVDVAKETENGATTVDDEQSGLSVDYTSTLEGTAFTVRDRDGVLSPMTFNTAEEAQKGAEKMSQMKQGRQMDMEKRAEVATRVAQVFAPGRNVVLVQSDKDMKAAAVAEGGDGAIFNIPGTAGALGVTTPNGTIVLNVAATTSFDELVQTVKHETGHSVADEAGLTKLMAGKTVDGIAAKFQKAGIIAPGADGLEKFVKAVESVRAQRAALGVKQADADAVGEVLSLQQEGMAPVFRKRFGDSLVTLLRGKDKSAKNMRDVRRAVALIMYGGREAKVDLFGGTDAWKAPAPAFTGDPIAAAGTETGEKEAVEPAEEAAPEAMPAQGEEAPGAEAVPPVAAPEAKSPAAPSPEAKAAAKDIKAAFEEKQKAKAPVDEAAPVETPPEAPKAEAPKAEPPAPATPVAKMTFPSEEAMLEYVAAHQEETENWTEESFEIVPAPAPAKSDGAPIVPTSDAGQGEAVPPKAEEKRPDAAPFEVEGLKFNGVQRIEGMEDQQVWTDTATGGTFFMPGDADKAAVEAYRDGSRKKFEDAKKPAPAKPEAPRNDGSLFPEKDIPFNLEGEAQEDVVRLAAEKKAEEERLAEAKRKKDAEPILPGIDNEKKEVQNADQERGAEKVAGGEQARGIEKDGGGDSQGSEAAGQVGKSEGEGLQERAVEVEPQVAKMSAEVTFESVPKKGQYAEIPGVSTAQGKRMYLIQGKWGDGNTFHVSPTHHGIVLTGMGVLLRTKGQPSAHSGVRIVGGGKAPAGSEKWGVAEWATHNQKLSNRHKEGAKPTAPTASDSAPTGEAKPVEAPKIEAPKAEPPVPAPKMKFTSEEEMMRYVSAHPELNWTGDEFEIVPDEKGEAAPAAPQAEQEAAPPVAQFEPPKIKYGENTAAHRRRVAAAKAEWDAAHPEKAPVAEAVARAESETAVPTKGQKEAGNYKKGRFTVHGMEIAIENPVGSVRTGVTREGKPWRTEMKNTYGYFAGESDGKDGDKLDVFLGPDVEGAPMVYVIDQVDPASGTFDEHKVMLGFPSEVAARAAYLANYQAGWKGLKTLTGVPVEAFKAWMASSDRKLKPFAEYSLVKKEQPSVPAQDAKDTEEIAELQANAETQARVRAIPDAEYAAAPALAAFDVALPIYEKQTAPDRTALKRELQQFSTPVTLAVLAAHGAYGARTFVEPTIGNAALTAGLRPDADGNMPRILGNELDAGRAARANDFIETSFGQKDAVTVGDWAAEAFQNAVKEAAKSGKVAYAMNPPFGSVNPATGMKQEHDIVIKTIESAVPGDTLFAILQAPGRNAMKMTTGALAGVYTAGAFAKFHQELNRRGWKATLHFIADGALYRKMGASFPVEVLLMEKTDGSEMNPHMPMRDLPARYSTWEQIRAAVAEMYDPGAETLGERVANDLNLSGKAEQARAEAQGNAEASSAEVNAARVKEGAAGTLRYRLSQDIELGLVTPETGLTLNPFMMKINGKVWDKEFAGKVRNPDQLARHILSLPAEIAEARIKVADAIAKHLAANPANGFVTGTGFNSMGPALREAFEARWNAARTTDMDAEEGKAQIEYSPLSAVKTASPMKMPRELAGGMAAALSSFDERHPEGIDTFVAEKMGRPMTEKELDGSQIDTLGLALEKIDEGTGFIVGSMTGSGKGRVMSSVMDYHILNGRVPIFLTAQAKLFTDIWRDITAIGAQDRFKPLVMNDYKAPKNEDPDSEDVDAFSMPVFFTPVQRNSALSEGKLPQGANAIFLTYSQVQNPTANTRRKIDLIKKLLASGKGALVMDEAHLAAGADSNRGAVLREFADLAKPGVVFSSATFAKRGENMTLYKRAGYSQFFKNDEDMEKALMVGGVPFQQYLAARLTERGFYVRHELDYEGVIFEKLTTIDTLGTPQERTTLAQHEEQIADVFNQVVRTVMRFGGMVKTVNSRLQKGAPGANMDGAAFMSSLHNTASFIYTALKAETVANAAVAELRAGRAPVVTLYNTNQALLTEIGLNQSANVGHYLTRISERAVSIQMPDGSSASILTPAGFGELVRLVKAQEATMLRDAADALVRQARSAADYLQEQNLPASPIDRVREIVQNAGYQFGEVTGRTVMVQNGVVVRRIKPNPDTVIRQFNQGAPDGSPNMVLLLNSSGSTGLSAHASSDFRNQARRVMFVLQPSWDINEMMQMFGRVNRKNQLSKPIYHLVFTSAAGEQRNAAILMSKLRSLAANTSGVSKAGYGEAVEDALDFMNAFGDKALAELAAERNPVVASINTLRASKAIRAATSISQFLPVREQEQFIGQIQAKVAALQDNAREAGLHDLEAGDIGRVPLTVEQLLSNSAMRAYEVPVLGRGKILTASEAVAAAQAWQAKHPTMLDDAKAKIDKAIAGTSNPWLKRIYGDTAQVLEHALDSIGQVYYVRDDVGRRWFVPIEAHLPPSGTAQTASDWRVKVSFNTIRGVTTIPLSIFADKILSNAAKSSERNYNQTLTRKEDRTIIAGDVAQALIGNIVATGASGASQIVRALPVDGNFSSFVLMMPRGVTVANAKKIVSSRLEKVTDVMDIRVGQNGYLEIDAGRVKVTPTYSSTTGDQIGAVFAFRIATPVKSKSKEITVAQIMRAARSESRLRDTPNSQGYVTGPYLGVDESNTALKNLAALHPALQATQIVSDEAKVGGQDAVARNAPRFKLAGVTLDAEYADAVAKGDMETAQRMVDEAAKAAGYNVGPVYHGTDSKRDVFDRKFLGRITRGTGTDWGFFFTDNESLARKFAEQANPDGGVVERVFLRAENPAEIEAGNDGGATLEQNLNDMLMDSDYDSARIDGLIDFGEQGETWLVVDSSQIKSADPATYDDNGDLIPLSRRFDDARADIRFKLPGVTLDGGISAPVRVGELRTQTQLENDDPVGFPILDHIRGGSRIIIPRGALGRKGEYNWFTSIGGFKAFNFAERKAFFRHPKAALGEKKSHGNIDRLAKELEPQLGTDDVETFANAFMEEVERSRALYRVQKERQARRRDALAAVSEHDMFKGKANIGETMGLAMGSVYAGLTGEAKTTMDMILTHEGDEAGRDYMLTHYFERIIMGMVERYAFLEGRYETPPEVEDRALSVNVPINEDGDTQSVYAQTKETLRLLAARFYAPNPAGVATITDEDAAVFMRESLDAGGPEFLRDLAEKMIAERLTGQRDTALNKYQTALMLWYQTDLDAQTMETDRLAQEAADMNDLSNLKGVDMMRDRIHGKTLDYLNAARQYGSLAGQSLQALKLRVDHAFNIVKIYRQAYQDNGDIALTPQQYAALKARVAALEKKWNDYMEAASLPDGEAELDARVVELEKKLADATASRDSLKATVAQLEAKKAALEAEYAKQSGEATAFSEKKAQLEAQIAGLENEIALREALNQQVEELQGKVDALQAKLDALDAEYAGASPELLASLEKQLADLTKLHAEKLAAYQKADEELKTANERLKRVRKLIEKLGKGTKAKIARRRAVLENAANLYGEFKAEMERAQVERLKNRWRGANPAGKTVLAISVTRDLIRALQSMGDESVAGRQLAKLGLAHPFLWARAWAQSQPLVFSRAGAVGEDGHLLTWAERSDRRLFELDQMMREHPMFDVLVRKGGMSWMDLTADPQSFDEQQTPVGPLLRAMLPSKFTRGYTSLLEVSNNHYAGMSNMLRFSAACQLYEKFNVAKGGTPTAEDIQAIVSTVDIFGGRGNLTSDRARSFVKFAGHFLYSPRLAISNVQFFKRMAGFAIDPSTSGRAKAMIATEYLRLGATYAVISILARLFSKMLSDDPDEQRFQFDPGHSAFLTLMRGQRRMDISGGAAMWARSVSQILGIGDKLDTETGLVTQEWADRQNLDWNAVGRLVRSKLDPWTGMTVDLLAGKTYSGQAAGPRAKANFPDYAWRYPNLTSSIAPVPLSIQSLADMLRGDTEQGIAPLRNPLHLLEAFGAQFVGTGASSLPVNPELAQEVDEGYTRNAEEMRTLKNRLQGVLSDRKMSPEMKELKAGRIQDKLDRLRGL